MRWPIWSQWHVRINDGKWNDRKWCIVVIYRKGLIRCDRIGMLSHPWVSIEHGMFRVSKHVNRTSAVAKCHGLTCRAYIETQAQLIFKKLSLITQISWHVITSTIPGLSINIWVRHKRGVERATVSTNWIWPNAETTANRDVIDGRNLRYRGSTTVWIGDTALNILKSYAIRKRSTTTVIFPCLQLLHIKICLWIFEIGKTLYYLFQKFTFIM